MKVGMHFDGNADTPTPGIVERLCFESLSDVCSAVNYEFSMDTNSESNCTILVRYLGMCAYGRLSDLFVSK